jgi:hypothetical protein
MTRFSAVIMLICVLAACMLPAQAATTRVPYGSFLTRPVSGAADFAQLLRQDKVVAQRFADHYGINNDALADYFEKYGQTITISKSNSYLEYFIDKYGRVQKHHKLLRPGTKILAVKGTPILDLRCGNPMNKALPKIVEKVEPIVQELPAPAPAPEPEVLLEPAPAPAPVQVAEKPLEYPTAVTVAVAPRVNELVWLLPGLVGLGTLGGGNEPGPPIPETSALLLGVGGTGFVLAWYRRLRNR